MSLFTRSIMIFLGCFLLGILPQNAFAQALQGVFMVVKGDVKVISTDGKSEAAKVGKKVSSGDTIQSGPDSRAKIVMADKNVINISPDSKIVIEKYENDGKDKKNVELKVEYGKIRASVEEKYDGEKSKFNIKTPSAVAGVRGTDFLTGYSPSTKVTQVVTFNGTVAVGKPGPGGTIQNAVFVKQGQMTSASANGSPDSPKAVPKEELSKMNSDTKAETSKNDSPKDGSSNSEKKSDEKKEEESKDESKKEENKKSDEKKEEPKKEESLKDDSKKEDGKKSDEKKSDEKKNQDPKKEEMKKDDPKKEEPKKEEPKKESSTNKDTNGSNSNKESSPKKEGTANSNPSGSNNNSPKTEGGGLAGGGSAPTPNGSAPGSSNGPSGSPTNSPAPAAPRSPASIMPPMGMININDLPTAPSGGAIPKMPVAGPIVPVVIPPAAVAPTIPVYIPPVNTGKIKVNITLTPQN